MYPRSQEAAIQRASECEIQTISAFGKSHPCALQAAELREALTAAAESLRMKDVELSSQQDTSGEPSSRTDNAAEGGET